MIPVPAVTIQWHTPTTAAMAAPFLRINRNQPMQLLLHRRRQVFSKFDSSSVAEFTSTFVGSFGGTTSIPPVKYQFFPSFFLLQKFHLHNARALHCWIIQIPNWRIYCLLSSLVSILDIVQLLYISSRTSHNCQNWQQRMKPCVTAEEIASPSSFYPLSSNYYHFFILLLLFLCVTTHI